MIFYLLAQNCLYQEQILDCLKKTTLDDFKSFYREAIPLHLKKTRDKNLAQKILSDLKFLYLKDYPFIFSIIEEFQEISWFEPYLFDEEATSFYQSSMKILLWKSIFKPMELSNQWILKAKKDLLNLYIEYPNLADHSFHEKFYNLLNEEEKKLFLMIFYFQNHLNKDLINKFFILAKKEKLSELFYKFTKNDFVPGVIFNKENPRSRVLKRYSFQPEIYLNYCSQSPLKNCPGYSS